MAFLKTVLPIAVLVSSALAQFEGYGFEGHGLEGYKQPAVHHQGLDSHHDEYEMDYHAHPKYAFDYSVKDPHTGDDKEHWETRDGDKVKGSYTIVERDGTKRVVEYEADDKNGFNAVVHRIGAPKGDIVEDFKPQKQHFEPYHQGFDGFDEGFVPVAGGFGH